MNSFFRAVFVTLCIFVFLSKLSVADSGKGNNKKSKIAKQQKDAHTTKPIDLNSSKLSAHYLGHDPKVLYDKLLEMKQNINKSEFETTEQYNTRTLSDKKRPILGVLGLDDFYTLNISPHSKYDADNSTMTTLIIAKESTDWFMPGNQVSINAKELKNKKKSYIGTNAYGASVEVENTYSLKSGLVVINSDGLGLKNKYIYEYILTNISADMAKSLKDKLRVLLIFKLHEPYTSPGYLEKKATIDYPYSETEEYYYIHGEIKEAWVYNYSTGDILLKEKY
jgi:hypothetical protein